MPGMVVIPANRKRSGRGFDSRHLHHYGGVLVSTGWQRASRRPERRRT